MLLLRSSELSKAFFLIHSDSLGINESYNITLHSVELSFRSNGQVWSRFKWRPRVIKQKR